MDEVEERSSCRNYRRRQGRSVMKPKRVWGVQIFCDVAVVWLEDSGFLDFPDLLDFPAIKREMTGRELAPDSVFC
jgi:hypothetical protein